jgi:signal transduction histidine kinase
MAESPQTHILLMEDDPGLARLFQKRLAREGYEVDIARDGAEGLAMYDAGAYDLLVMDQVMPVYTGLEVIRLLAERGPLPPTIMVTGTGSEQIAVEAMKLGAGDYVVKDVDGGYFDLLPTVIEQVLQQRRLVEEKERASAALQDSHRRLAETLAELQATQEQVIRQERLAAIGNLSAGIAHNFNNILTGIIMAVDLLLLRPNLPASIEADLRCIKGEGQRAAHLVQQLLDFGRKSLRHLEPFDLALLLDEWAEHGRRTLPANIDLLLEVEPGSYSVRADRAQVQQILANLADRAQQAMPHGGTLALCLSHFGLTPGEPPPLPEMPPGRWLVLTATDTGLGFSPEVLPHVFEPFFTTRGVGESTGLGLAQVYGIVMQHEGHIHVTSQVGKGTTFTIYLPALEAKRWTDAREDDLPHGCGETILLVMNDELLLKASQVALEDLGYDTLAAQNSREALELLGEHRAKIALTLIDSLLPEIDRASLVTAISQSDPQVRRVLITEHLMGDSLTGHGGQGAQWQIQKPITIEQLARTVHTALKASSIRAGVLI